MKQQPSTDDCRQAAKPAQRAMLAATVLLCLASAVRADEEPSIFSLSGFGALGAVYLEGDGVQFQRDISQPHGTKANRLDLAQDSMLGVQLTAKPSEQWQATVQLVSRHAINTGFQPQVSWAYIKYKPVDNVSLRAGRLGLEMYLSGDSADIGYANLMIRQPVVFYPRAHDGVDGDVTLPVGDGTLRLKGMVGNTLGKMMSSSTDAYEIDAPIWGALVEYSRNGWTGRLSTGQLKLRNELGTPDAVAVRTAMALTPNGDAINRTLRLKDRSISYDSLALAYDDGPLQAQVNLSRISSSKWSPQNIFFGHLGYRLGQFTPYAAYSIKRTERSTLPTGIPQGLSPQTDVLNMAAGLAQGNSNKINESTFAIGVRYDFARNAALKIQADRFRYRDPSCIIDPSTNTVSFESRQQKEVSLLSVALEFVF